MRLGRVAITLVFFLLKKTIGLRVSREEEIDGLDIHEHGSSRPTRTLRPCRWAW